MTSAEVRQKFLDFFAGKDHEVVPSSPLVPGNDPTLLFTNAGMVQFKDAFLGEEVRPNSRATSSQRCVRAGGKHNDLENVGYTARHHTFFEMLGNFSFGDYFKREAIQFAWEFLTEELGLAPEKLWVTVFQDDDEAASIWLDEIKITPDRFSRLGEKDNFWAMGDTGPCGPCSEIFYDHGPEVAGGPPGSPDEDGDRYVEIWNLVFMQFERKPDGSLTPLPKPSVDTGAGLERLAAVLQNVHSNYEIDLFQNLLTAIGKITDVDDLSNTSLRVIADHIRSCSFLVVDGVSPSNEGRGYVLRRIIRRAVRHGYQLGVKDIFFYQLVTDLVKVMGDAYPELKEKQQFVERVLQEEEQQFARTLENGMVILEKAIAELDEKVLPGETVFKLYDTYGFPVDLTADVARENDLSIDMDGFDQAMSVQKDQARSASNFSAVSKLEIEIEQDGTEFIGYEHLEGSASVLAVYLDNKTVNEISGETDALLVLDNSPFYGESGGQVGDTGVLENDATSFAVSDTQKQGDYLIHSGTLQKGVLKVGDSLATKVSSEDRVAITLNHSATHLMHAALRNILGDHVTQKGSLVNAEHLRFDFSHPVQVTRDELGAIESAVNQQVLNNTDVSKQAMSIDEAKERGALALFGEKYGDEVRVVSMGDAFSTELCGGTHIDRTGNIGLFKIISESGIAAGIRRIEAVAGNRALEYVIREEQTLKEICDVVKTSSDGLVDKVKQLATQNRTLEKQLEQMKAKMASSAGTDLVSQAEEVNGIKLLATAVEGFNPKALRDTVDQLKNKLGSSVIVLASSSGDKVNLVAGVSKDLTAKVKAGELVNMIAEQVGGKGGGRPDMAMAGGNDPGGVPAAIGSVKAWVEERL
ncbi:MAG: alanine--tRNA ligase [Gammaproteobacteria bacterium]|jgi:alanyl-tRNA synthetase|nr:alanine--tRNA ligase [Gammaproteobacteria bacterium]HJO12457.1 alanine--tRNA ligase [Gammaproteobacteria bacterium]|tara:strand:- start:1345 stop:3945 length:2601 start_codon:yes stop_codon:yes gene_type:complete